jgi:phosphoglycerol transferase MdoB-like AlkP superfamily enzyme
MNDFWTNISRYPRFFISSLAGLILIILAPFKNLFKIPKLRIFLIISFSLFCLLLSLIIQNMSGV